MADPEDVLTFTVAGVAPPATVMANVPLTKAVKTVPSGVGVGRRTVHGTDHPVGFAGSCQRAEDPPHALTLPAVPPKLTAPLVVVTKAALAPVPLVMIALTCVIAVSAALVLMRQYPWGGSAWLAIFWWLAFSGGLCAAGRRARSELEPSDATKQRIP